MAKVPILLFQPLNTSPSFLFRISSMRYYMLLAATQSGKSPAIIILAYISWFKYHRLPWVFIKSTGGEEQFKSSWVYNVTELNNQVTAILRSCKEIGSEKDEFVYRQFHLKCSYK